MYLFGFHHSGTLSLRVFRGARRPQLRCDARPSRDSLLPSPRCVAHTQLSGMRACHEAHLSPPPSLPCQRGHIHCQRASSRQFGWPKKSACVGIRDESDDCFPDRFFRDSLFFFWEGVLVLWEDTRRTNNLREIRFGVAANITSCCQPGNGVVRINVHPPWVSWDRRGCFSSSCALPWHRVGVS